MNKLDATPQELSDSIKELYGAAAGQCYQGSQADVPVGETGDLKGSGYIDIADSGDVFHVDVGYGDGNDGKTYSYSSSDATTQYPADSGLEATGYSWFVELGHLSRAGNPVPPQPFLGPNFDKAVQDLEDSLRVGGFS